MSNPDHIHEIIAGALFDFAGFLTSLPKERAVTFSGSHNASPAVTLLTEWATNRGLQLDEAQVKDWESALVAPTEAAAMAATVPAEWLSDQVGGEFDDMTSGQGYRKGWNDCRKAMLAPQAPVADQPAEPSPHIEAWTWFDAAGEYHLSRDEPGDGESVLQLTALVAAPKGDSNG